MGEFDLPEKYARNTAHWSPCPCCRAEVPWFKRAGKIAWFPDEGVIRLIGPDCYRSLNPEGHDEAVAKLRKIQAREKQLAFVLRALVRLPEMHDALDAFVPTAKAIDPFRVAVSNALATHRVNLWREIQDGRLIRHVRKKTVNFGADGRGRPTFKARIHVHAHIRGYRLLDPQAKPIFPRFEAHRRILEAISEGRHTNAMIEAMSDHERLQLATVFSNANKELRALFDELDELRRFVFQESVATLRTWGRMPDASLNFYIDRRDGYLTIGHSERESDRIPLPLALEAEIPSLPQIGELDS